MKIKNHLTSSKTFNVEELLHFLAKVLEIDEDVELTLIYNDALLNKLSKQIEYSALLYTAVPKQYILYVREGIDLKYILCHEFIHLKQHENGDLKYSSDFSQIVWKGQIFDNSYPYDKREWEQEAFTKQFVLWKMFKQFKRRKNERVKTKV